MIHYKSKDTIKCMLIIILSILSDYTFTQQKSDLDKEKLNGKIRSVYSFSANTEHITPYTKTYYNESGNLLEYTIIEDGNKYSKQYIYDNYKNEIEYYSVD